MKSVFFEEGRRSIRLAKYDYSAEGYYFVTICAKDRKNLFGKMGKEKIMLSTLGHIVRRCWEKIPEHFSNVQLDQYVIMPNHIHGIIQIVGVQNFEPLRRNMFQKIIPNSLGSILRAFKAAVTKSARENDLVYTVWQRNFHDHIIRDETDLVRIREYIFCNSLKWENDEENMAISSVS